MGNIELPQVIYKGQPVLTARAVAEVLGCNQKSTQSAYLYNRRRFLEGKHVATLTAQEAKRMGMLFVRSRLDPEIQGLNFFRYSPTGVTLFTREGVALLATIVTTEKAWAFSMLP